MALRKIGVELIKAAYSRPGFSCQIHQKTFAQVYFISTRNIFRSTLMKGFEIVSNDQLDIIPREGKLPLIETKKDRPLMVLCPWMGCTPKQSDKFVDLYLNKGFDIMLVSCMTTQVIWFKGVERKASLLLEFLHDNICYQPIVYHGFSVGNGLWCTMVYEMSQNYEKYLPTANRIKGQIWDCAPQTSNIVRNACLGAIPRSRTMGQLLYRIVKVILTVTRTDTLTPTYNRNNQYFHKPPFPIPSLIFFCKNDIFSEFELNMAAFESWKSMGIEAYIKWWENSVHVGHFYLHREEYLNAVNSFLSAIGTENQEVPEVTTPYEIPQIQKINIPNIR